MENLILANYYDENARKQQVHKQLDAELGKLRSQRENSRKEKAKSGKSNNIEANETKTYVEEMNDRAEELQKKCNDFEGPHFNKIYRTLNANVANLQLKLDDIDVAGRDDIRDQRKSILRKLNTMVTKLNEKNT